MKKKMFLVPFLLASTLSFFIATFPFGAAVLPDDEVEALREIGKTLGKTDWDFSVDPCSGSQYGWIKLNQSEAFANNVTCGNCSSSSSSSNGTVCHVVSIMLRGQNLPGTLPSDLARLPYLQQFDLARNYLNGSIPSGWGSSPQLVDIFVDGNRLTGSIPKELGNITTLKSFVVEFNNLSGNLPPELGNMSSIEIFHFTSNNFTGELPDSFASLINLKEFRISDNQFSGKIPNYIENWTKLEKLAIQASGLNGPIPPGIAHLENLFDLRISDLNGSQESFPSLNTLIPKLEVLILRSCNITGQLPEYFDQKMTGLEILDLSFNNLSGEIPSSFATLPRRAKIFLTGNLLSGKVPPGMLSRSFGYTMRREKDGKKY